MRIGWLVNATIWKGRCRYEMFCIYQPPNAHADFGDFAKQRNGGGSHEKDL
jgi:hypothetical protein